MQLRIRRFERYEGGAQDVLSSTAKRRMNLSYIHKLLLAADPFAAVRKNFRGWQDRRQAKEAKPKGRRARHLTCKQRADIVTGLQDSAIGPVSMTATASDQEAVGYEGEIANVLEETGFAVEIDNATGKTPGKEITAGVEMIIKDETVRPIHAFRIVHAFRLAGVSIATRISALRRKNNTLYITIGPKDALPAVAPPTAQTAAVWQIKSMALVVEKWKGKFRR
jgi:hypothetical protein